MSVDVDVVWRQRSTFAFVTWKITVHMTVVAGEAKYLKAN